MRTVVLDTICLAGVSLILYGLWIIYPPLCAVVAGLFMCVGAVAALKK